MQIPHFQSYVLIVNHMYYKVYPFEIEEFLFFCSSLYMMNNPMRKGDMRFSHLSIDWNDLTAGRHATVISNLCNIYIILYILMNK